jgi:hypothetical protein
VRDTGIGLTDSIKQRLFMAFERGDLPEARQTGGTGLGLAICKRLVDAMGGTITADGAPGRGARFALQVPATALRPAGAPDAAPAPCAPPVRAASPAHRAPSAPARCASCWWRTTRSTAT